MVVRVIDVWRERFLICWIVLLGVFREYMSLVRVRMIGCWVLWFVLLVSCLMFLMVVFIVDCWQVFWMVVEQVDENVC